MDFTDFTDFTDRRKKEEEIINIRREKSLVGKPNAPGKGGKYRAIKIALYQGKLLNQRAVDKAANCRQGDRPQYRAPKTHPQAKSFN